MADLRIDISDLGLGGADPVKGGPAGKAKRPSGGKGRGWFRRLRWAVLLGVLLATVPFVLLLRGSVHAHVSWGAGPWPSVGVGIAFALLTVGLGVWVVSWMLKVPGGLRRLLSRGAALVGLAFLLHGLLYLGARHAKGDAVRAEYRALHPLLRTASTVLVLVDREAVVTDARRNPEDYRAMGLSPVETSLHYPQPDGYVHALDLRTAGRPEWRNRLVEWGFRLMGFRVLRHVGTADHLHVSLPPGGTRPDAVARSHRPEAPTDGVRPLGRVPVGRQL